jgi:beta-lactamase regulating signal transducer with metallopeptidase domain
MPPAHTSALALANLYLCANLLLAAAAASLAALRAFGTALPRPLTYRHLLIIGRVLAVTALLLPALALWRGDSALSPLKAQVWSAPSMSTAAAAIPGTARIELGSDSQHALVPLNAAADAFVLLFAAGLLITLLPLLPEALATFRAVSDAHLLRRMGHVRILISDRQPVPFAAWIPGRCLIVLPATLLLRPADLRLALRHEGQHHRQRDTRYLYAVLLGRALFGLNPAAHWLARQLLELQEFACDEQLARRPGHSARAYCACLLRVAEAAATAAPAPLRSFMAGSRAGVLARRMQVALRPPVRPLPTPAAAGISVVALALLMALSAVTAAPIQDRRLSRAAAEQLAAAAYLATAPHGSATFPLTVNDAVVAQLNLLLGTLDGRAFLRASIARMRAYRAAMLAELQRHDLPPQLLAVPLVESGYRNLPAGTGPGAGEAATGVPPGAGLWMFMRPTARHYGLEVSAVRDQRLDVRAETRAAVRMLSDLQRQFRDWPLALMAYNSGAAHVEAAMNATRSHDAWTLYRAGYGNDPDYLARTMAVILILANPRLLD